MLSKMQKGLLWLFSAMFLVPEILFLNTIVFIGFFFSIDVPTIFSIFIKGNDFSQIIFIFSIIIEIIGVFGLFVFSIKFRKVSFSIILGIIILWLLFISYLSIGFSQMSLVG